MTRTPCPNCGRRCSSSTFAQYAHCTECDASFSTNWHERRCTTTDGVAVDFIAMLFFFLVVMASFLFILVVTP